MWDWIVEFFGGDTSTSAFASEGMIADAAIDAVSSWDLGAMISNVFGSEGMIADVAGDVVKGVTSSDPMNLAKSLTGDVMKEGGDIARQILGGDAKPEKGVLETWWDNRSDQEKAEIFKIGGGMIAGAAGGYFKGKSDRELLDRKYELESDLMRQKQEMNKVPAGVPFRAKPGAPLMNRAGQPVALPYNPMQPRQPGLINGRIYG